MGLNPASEEKIQKQANTFFKADAKVTAITAMTPHIFVLSRSSNIWFSYIYVQLIKRFLLLVDNHWETNLTEIITVLTIDICSHVCAVN